MMTNVDRIREALQFIDASDRVTWLRIGMAIKSEIADAGFDLWESWSQQAESFNGKDARDVWKSIRAGGKVSIGSLFYEAKANGWHDDGGHQMPTPEELAERRRIAAERAEKEEAEITRERADTAAKAAAIMKAATEAKADHPYLERKRVLPTPTLREIDSSKAAAILGYSPKSSGDLLTGRLLVVPVKQSGSISTLELIDGDKRKAALSGRGSKVGGYWATERLPDSKSSGLTLLIGEGVATVLSASTATGKPGIAALSSGNLPTVAKTMRECYSQAAIVILADLVKTTGEPDPHAIEAARSVGGKLAIPDFGTDRDPDMTDMNDLFILGGADAVISAVTSASEPTNGEHQPGDGNAPAGEYARDVNLIRASELTPEPITWLWNGWLAAGKMHVFGGAPGTGKTTISMGLAATVTTGGHWPDGTRSIAGNVVIWSGEDDPADTLIPRLALSGADLSRVYFIADIREGNERRSFDPARDMEPLRRKLAEIGGVRLLIVDPVVSAIAGDSHKNAEVRRGLQPLVDLAGAMRCALLGITHFSKGTGGRDPVERLTGSLAFGALARVVLVAAKHQEEGEDGHTVRLFCRAKSNIGPDDGGFEYDLHQAELKTHPGIFASSVLWGDAVEGAARELLATADATGDDGEGGTLADAKRFLADLLSDGPLPTKTIKVDADGAGYSWATIRRAQKALGIEPAKEGMKAGWVWRMPGQGAVKTVLENAKMLNNAEDAQQKVVSTFGKIEHLRNELGAVEVEI
ncbi:AAA family ATPase [Propionivibrio dicarboxylicus]|uniref:Putative DNA primase/helicase n=1 Tax=Propionivibrio dicarboxylicus TaxID=83767 RepID=A0A1G7WLU4_9RHOO|nr:AAA family ATPase [Propionivibrio dicarboxylicus]SDG72190.1 putative DNA primase/helicase [Propionivibrio dicarboxylicus]